MSAWRELLETAVREDWLSGKGPTNEQIKQVGDVLSTLAPLQDFIRDDIGFKIYEVTMSLKPDYPKKDTMQLMVMEHMSYIFGGISFAYIEANMTLFEKIGDADKLNRFSKCLLNYWGLGFQNNINETNLAHKELLVI
ncbi:MAG: hypothetical protein JKY95_12430 [Planctomycetaceae bacterium]|nr:hypothetical protein [Planctomycetaceae bacterium]